MIDVKQAVKAAFDFIIDIYGPKKLKALMLEEVELSEDEKYWLVTLGFNQASPKPRHPLQPYTVQEQERVYKSIKIDADTGVASALKIRTV